ncbi:MAG: ABC transporter substrate-binding protein, partial [Bdellovibrionales bacterium]|nr:ABC transporter substrate-binding protein [Bdellovibrionales bacterium]
MRSSFKPVWKAFICCGAFLVLFTTEVRSEPIKIGWIGPLTGDAAVLGMDSMPAAQMVFEEVNSAGGIAGRRIELVVEDDQYLTAKTVSAYQKLVHQDKVNVVITLTYGGLFAIAERAQRDDVLLIDPLDCDQRIAMLPENVICISKRSEDLGLVPAAYVVEQELTPAAVLYFDGDPFMGVVAEATKNRLMELQGVAPLLLTYNNQNLDFRPQLLRIRASGAKSIFFYGYDSLGRGMAEARGLGIDAAFVGLNTVASPDFMALAGSALEGSHVSLWRAPRTPRFTEFIEQFRQKVGREPRFETSMIPSYDIATLIVKALRDGGTSADGRPDMKAIKSSLYSTKDFEGLSGT